ncbi:MAG: nucleoside hydrolase [Acidimicrobiaceae bacterium]|nr:nucleoside hydrolase [Acidimicrobiaceae bacterium]MXW60461.1 nucleoside hydrolase [Acidimicrobiaceae bacterium]MXW74687.1 nucleoside hydrolase [Acidimicrobiaceae bacterium]MYC41336.1 nucleoside hydrolase [Acidimicrobiaceae bacterium]MYD05393.1 nucleoside hydrolase [Acidimicrobiaceae bacterium]
MRRFLIDTDTASDDAVALVMALRHADINVEAITVVSGNVGLDQAVQNALYTVELCGADVPVYAGAASPMMRSLETAQYVHGEDGMGDAGLLLSGRVPAEGRGAEVIVETILGAPGEITLVALGPLTNVAIAVLLAPEIADAVDRVVVMGGTGVHGPGNVSAMAEYNFWADPEAAAVVSRAGFPIEFVGWDISIASAVVDADRHEAIKAIGTPLSKFAVDISQVVRRFAMENGLAGDDLPDPIAMAHAIDPSVATTQRLHVDVMVGDGPQRGVLEVDQLGFGGGEPNVDIVTHYPSDHFFSLLHAALRD